MNEGALDKMPTLSDMLIGNMGGSLGEVSALALLLGMFYMLWKKIITWHVPVSIFVTVFVFTGIMHLVNPVQYASPFVHLFVRRSDVGSYLHGDRLCDFADEQERYDCLRCRHWYPDNGYPSVRFLIPKVCHLPSSS